MEQAENLRRDVKPADCEKVFRRACERELDRILLVQTENPERSDLHRAVNTHYARYFTLLATEPRLARGELDDHAELVERGLTSDEADSLIAVAHRHRDRPAVSPGQVAEDLRQEGIEPSERNMRLVARIVAAAYRNANIAACSELGSPLASSEVWPLPPALARFPSTMGTAAKPPAHGDWAILNPISSPQDEGGEKPNLRATHSVSQIAEIVLCKRIEDGGLDPERRRDIKAAAALFIAANGDIPFSSIRQEHLVGMKSLFPRLPVHYGRKFKNEAGEERQETIQEALMRGDELRRQWDSDPVAADKAKLPYVGLSVTTQCKHLTWLKALETFVAGHMVEERPSGLDFAAIRKSLVQPKGQGERTSVKSGKKKNQARLPWEKNELRNLFETPVWQGCRGLWHRLTPGDEVIHDGFYWAPLLLVTTAARSDEICGLAVDDVVFDSAVPYLHIRVTAFRRIKSIASDRKIPIASTLLGLGFEDYWRAIRDAGHEVLFPEFLHPTMDFEKCFRKYAFAPLRDYVFPNGTSRMRGRKDVDAHSLRTTGSGYLRDQYERSKDASFSRSHRKALIGHEQGDTTEDIYEEDYTPRELLAQVEHLATLLPEIARHPLNLRPPEWQKFGSPRGRPKKL